MIGNVTAPSSASAAPGASPVDTAGNGAPGRVLVAAVIAGTGAAITVPLTRPGLGWLLAAALATIAIATATYPVPLGRIRRNPTPDAGPSPDRTGTRWIGADLAWRLSFGGAAFALTAMAAVRAAGWVVALCLVTAAASGVLAIVRGRRRHDRDRERLEVVRWAARGARLPGSAGTARRLVRALAIGVSLLLLFGTLFVLADLDFRHAVRGVAPWLSPWRAVQGAVLFTIGTAVVLMAARETLAGRDAADPGEDGPESHRRVRRLRRLDWMPALAMLDALFAWFVGVQLPRLFGGNAYVLRPGGPDFAVYARDGFFLLLVVTALTLVVIGMVGYHAALTSWTDRSLVGVLCLLTLVVVASAGHRLATYVGAYGFTRARLTGAAIGVFLLVTLVVVTVAGFRRGARWLPRAVALTAVLTVLGLAAVNPDAAVADTVIARYEKDQHLDAAYLGRLSADAVPAIDRLPESVRSCLLHQVTAGLGRTDPWYAYDTGRQRARAILAAHPARYGCEGSL
jgi:hypothetical protein